jgi:hypothetical protein
MTLENPTEAELAEWKKKADAQERWKMLEGVMRKTAHEIPQVGTLPTMPGYPNPGCEWLIPNSVFYDAVRRAESSIQLRTKLETVLASPVSWLEQAIVRNGCGRFVLDHGHRAYQPNDA